MAEHPIQGLMKTAMASIKDMVDVNTIVGDAVETPDGTVIIPISRVTFGFAAGGGDYDPEEVEEGADNSHTAFGGGSGAGVSVRPVGFLVCSPTTGVRFMPVEGNVVYDRLIDMVPQAISKFQDIMCKKDTSDKMDELAETAETSKMHS
ncbi:GerW family sporulation protein [Dendrosporobacter sp. 1207_IL3150]|uniref:GerW family sporulation protein n=1 Tax=Dendrosporobacter sp. 1207_IL3150 TaxID=3084054 RepID=UPI002FD9AE61